MGNVRATRSPEYLPLKGLTVGAGTSPAHTAFFQDAKEATQMGHALYPAFWQIPPKPTLKSSTVTTKRKAPVSGTPVSAGSGQSFFPQMLLYPNCRKGIVKKSKTKV